MNEKNDLDPQNNNSLALAQQFNSNVVSDKAIIEIPLTNTGDCSFEELETEEITPTVKKQKMEFHFVKFSKLLNRKNFKNRL